MPIICVGKATQENWSSKSEMTVLCEVDYLEN